MLANTNKQFPRIILKSTKSFKNHFFLFILFLSVFASSGFSQGFNMTGISFNYAATSYFCDTNISVSVSPYGSVAYYAHNSDELSLNIFGTNLNNRVYSLTIDWGDNTPTTTHTGTSIADGTPINWSPAVDHSYSAIGSHNVTVTIQDSLTSQTKSTTKTIYKEACQSLFDIEIDYDCNLDGTADSIKSSFPIGSFYLVNGTDTIKPLNFGGIFGWNNSYQNCWPDSIPAGTYNLVVDSTYLSAFGLFLDTISPTTITIPLTGGPVQLNATVGCENTACLEGYLYCDDNRNGILDSNEMKLTNAPLVLDFNNSIDTVYTDTAGYYNYSQPSGNYTSTLIKIEQGWLISNGYALANQYGIQNNHWGNPSSSSIFRCDSSDQINIPIICNATVSDSVCFDGYTYLDQNNNGIKDTNEPIIPNVQIFASFRDSVGNAISGTNTTIYSDSSGYYSYSQYSPLVDSTILTISSWWLTNNNLNATNNPLSPNFKCDSAHFLNIAFTPPPTVINNLVVNATSHIVCDTFSISLSPVGLDSTSSDNLNIRFTGTNLLNQGYTFTVDWGDGTTTSHTGNSTTNNAAIIWTPALSHVYAASVNYQTIVGTLTSQNSTDSVSSTMAYVKGGLCDGFAINLAQNYLDCNNDSINDDTLVLYFQLDDVFLFNATDTIYPILKSNQNYYWPDSIVAGTYNLGFSSPVSYWSSLLQANPNNVNTVTFPNTGTIPIINQLFNCIPDTICFNAFVFCDDNGNGVFDPSETSLVNAPLTINTLGSTNLPNNPSTGSTDSNGNFSTSWVAYDSSTFQLSIDQNWLATNGHTITGNGSWYFNTWYNDQYLECDSTNNFNIPIICNLTAADSVCISGTIYHDLNGNGVQDQNEPEVPNAPISLNIYASNSNGFVLTTDTSGSYNYSGLHPNSDSLTMSISNYWLSNNGYTPLSTIMLTSISCDSNQVFNFGLSSILDTIYNLNLVSNPTSYNFCDTFSISISPFGIDTNSIEDLNFHFTGTNILNQNYTLNIDWGDGITTSHTGSSISNNNAINWSPALQHVYSQNILYHSVIATLNSASNYYSGSTSASLANVRSGFCDDFALNFQSNYLDCDNDGVIDDTLINSLAFDLGSVYLYNTTDTIYPISLVNQHASPTYYWPNTLSGTYSIAINPDFYIYSNSTLSANTIGSATFPNSGSIPSISTIFNCAADTICLSGYLFCDDNGNGIFDSTESIVPNAPLNINPYGSTNLPSNIGIDSTDSLGYYNKSWIAYDSSNFNLNISQNWLSMNNHSASDTIFYFSHWSNQYLTSCDTLRDFNIPIICNLTAADSVCISGTIYHDLNGNGVQDQNEPEVPNVPLNLSIYASNTNTNSFALTANTIGQYSYSGFNPNNDSLMISINNNWLSNNNYAYLSPSILTNISCDSNQIFNIGLQTISNVSLTGLGMVQSCYGAIYCAPLEIDIAPGSFDPLSTARIRSAINGSNILNEQYTAIVDWGDATTTTHTGTSVTNGVNIIWTPSISHNYSTVGAFSLGVTIIEQSSQDSISNTVYGLYNDSCYLDTICISGYLYCDDNNNNVLDATEVGIPNMPVDFSASLNPWVCNNTTNLTNTDFTLYTDATGYYDTCYVVYNDSAHFSLSLDTNSLSALGYVANQYAFILNYHDSIYFNSAAPVNYNIPINCNPSASDSVCVNGQVFCDSDGDGLLDTNETVLSNAPVTISLFNGSSFTTFSDSLGFYSYTNYHPNADSVTVIVPSYWLTNNGYNAITSQTVSTLDCSMNTNIALDCTTNLPCKDLYIFGGMVMGTYLQGWTNVIAVDVAVPTVVPGAIYTISVIMPTGVTYVNNSGLVNYTISGDTLTWSQTLSSTFTYFDLDFTVPAGIADSTLHTYQASVYGPNPDCDSTDNSMTFTHVVGASYDPNNKLVNLPQFIDPNMQETFYYTINFQNTGTAPAQDVYIEDQLSQYLDWSTLEVISKSHNMFYTVDAGGQITFTFPQIWLPDSTTNEPLSHGNVVFKIKESLTVPINQPIENTAHIFFDLNPPIVTNTTSNTNVINDLGLDSFTNIALKIYPNPTSGQLTVQSNEYIKNLLVYDLSGKLVYEKTGLSFKENLDLTDLSKGIYQVQVITEKGTDTKKLILE